MSSRRGSNDARAQKLALLEQLAQRRKQQLDGRGAQKRTIIGLTDSEDSGDDVGTSDSEESSDASDGIAPGFAAPSQALLSRLRRPGELQAPPPSEEIDLTDQLSSLGLEGGRGGNGTGGASTSAAPQPPQPPRPPQPAPPPRRSGGEAPRRPPASYRADDAPAAPKELDTNSGSSSAAAAASEGCLVLGDRGEFRLSPELSRKLYAHQVAGVRWLWGLHQVGAGGAPRAWLA
jgi:hypothetical protein